MSGETGVPEDRRAALEALAHALVCAAKDGIASNRFRPDRFPVVHRTVSMPSGDAPSRSATRSYVDRPAWFRASMALMQEMAKMPEYAAAEPLFGKGFEMAIQPLVPAALEGLLDATASRESIFAGSCMAHVRQIRIGSKHGMISPSTAGVEGLMMRFDPLCALVVGVVLMLLVVLSRRLCRSGKATPAAAKPPRAARDPKPFAGFTRKPDCPVCEQDAGVQPSASAPHAPPPRMVCTRGRHRYVETTGHFCPHTACAYHGRVGWGNLRANGHPGGRRWRQLLCLSCQRHVLETHGTPFHGKQVNPDKLVWAIGALAEGLGIRAVARVFETDPTTVLGWLVEAAEHLEAFSHHFVHDLDVEQVQMDELFALLRAVKDGEISEQQAIKRLSRSPNWVWVAMDPVCKLILTVDVGDRTLAIAQRLVHQVTQVLAPHCAPLFLTDGLRDYLTALVTHYGQWRQPERRQSKGPQPKPRWMPQPRLLSAQVIKRSRRRRIVGVKHRVIFGAGEIIVSILAKRGWRINTSFVERLNLDFRQHVAAIGRRVNTLCKHEAGVRQQVTIFQAYHNFVLPHASLRLPVLETTAIKRWQPRTPAMAAGLTDRVGSLREMLIEFIAIYGMLCLP